MKLDTSTLATLRQLCNYFESREIEFVLIGAKVPLILIELNMEGLGYVSRETRDLDFVVEVESWDEYKKIREDLLKIGFHEDERSPEHRIFWENTPIDLIPYGTALIKEDVLTWPKYGFTMKMIGYELVFKHIQLEKVDDNLKIPTIPLPLSVFTKVMAYLDHQHTRHLIDIIYILEHYEESPPSERRFEVGNDKSLTYETSGAYLLGIDLVRLINEKHLKYLKEFIELFYGPTSIIIDSVLREERSYFDESRRKFIIELIDAFKRGIYE